MIAAQMRAFSLAASDLLPQLSASPIAGERLAAVSFLQVEPNERYFEWLASRLSPTVEHAFVGYQAAVALRNAAAQPRYRANSSLKDAVRLAKEHASVLSVAADRRKMLARAEELLGS